MSTEQRSPPKDRYRIVVSEAQFNLLPCRMCGSHAELWQRWEKDDIWHAFVACTNLEDVDGEPCTFHLPDSNAFYHPRKKDAAAYWNLMMGPRESVTALVGSHEVMGTYSDYEQRLLDQQSGAELDRHAARVVAHVVDVMHKPPGIEQPTDLAKKLIADIRAEYDAGAQGYFLPRPTMKWLLDALGETP